MNYLYHDMSCEIVLGQIKSKNVSAISINQSIKKLTDTAVIKLPREFNRLEKDGKTSSLKNRNVRDYIKVGDPVKISLGYDGKNEEEFSGYIAKIGADIPLVIECEDEMWKLKQTNFTISYKSVSLKQLLNVIANCYEIDVIDDVELGKFRVDNASAYEVLEQLRKDYGLHSRFVGKVLKVGFPVSIVPDAKHEINLNRNVRALRNDLKFVSKDDVKVLIKAISINDDGKRLTADYGDNNGAVRTLHFTGKTLDELKELAEKNYKSLSFDGYQGKLPIWGVPRVHSGDTVEITDPNYPDSERDGAYLVEAVDITFNKSGGFKRDVKLSMKL